MYKLLVTIIFLIVLNIHPNIAQKTDYYIPINIQKAYQAKTRSWNGQPGPNYWQNRADYFIQLSFDPASRKISGSETINYINNSPDTLNKLVIHLLPNLYQKGHSRDSDINLSDESDGVSVENIKSNGYKIDISPSSHLIEYSGTNLKLNFTEPLLTRQETKLEISWHYELNKGSHNRTGAVDSTSFFVAYFFPRIAVYDDIDGWNNFNYTGTAEFYNDYGNFDVYITAPQNYIVWATGRLANPEQVLSEPYLTRYLNASKSDDFTNIIDSTNFRESITKKFNPQNTWNFKATNVTDFAFATSDHYLWDATSIVADSVSGRRVFINVAYNKDSYDFYQVARIARQSIGFMCHQFPAVPFPFPKITIFNGSDGMEYPMMVNNISKKDMNETIKLTAHEILHSYLPFHVGINETQYAWMDEGFTSFCDYLITSAFISPKEAGFYYLDDYLSQAGFALDTPVFAVSEFLKRPVYSYNSYAKPAAFFLVLKDYLGESLFKKTINEFMNRWQGKHPTPFDLFFTLENVSNQSLEWLIKPWFFEFGYVDLGIYDVMINKEEYKVIVKKIGNIPVPVKIKINFEEGDCEIHSEAVKIWQNNNYFTVVGQTKKHIKSVELIDESLIDADRTDNFMLINKENRR